MAACEERRGWVANGSRRSDEGQAVATFVQPLSFQLANSIEFAGPRSIRLRTHGERHYATRQEMACSL